MKYSGEFFDKLQKGTDPEKMIYSYTDKNGQSYVFTTHEGMSMVWYMCDIFVSYLQIWIIIVWNISKNVPKMTKDY